MVPKPVVNSGGDAAPRRPRTAVSTRGAADAPLAQGPERSRGALRAVPPVGPQSVVGEPDRKRHAAEFLLGLYRRMALIRKFEERVKFLFLEGIMPGTIHQCQGQEACAVGVCAALRPDDVVTSTHRPHGHALAKGLGVGPMMAELFGKATGCCKGKGGSMHMGDLAAGMVPAVAIVGGGVPIATGCALAFKLRKESRVAVCFMGDGAVSEGAFHEGVNMGAIWNLPVLYVVENNRYGASTPYRSIMRAETIAERAASYGIPGRRVDGNDVLAVYEAAAAAVDRAARRTGPHAAGADDLSDHGTFATRCLRTTSRRPSAKAALENEPIGRFTKYLQDQARRDAGTLDRIGGELDEEIEPAVKDALAAPDPTPEDALQDLFVEAP